MKLSQICLLLRLFLFSCRVRQVKFYLAILPLRFFSGIYSERCYSFSCFSLLFPVFYSHIIRLTGPCRVLIQRDDIIFFFSFILWSRMDVRNCTIAAHRSSIPMLLFFFRLGATASILSELTLIAVIAPSTITTRLPIRQDKNILISMMNGTQQCESRTTQSFEIEVN